MKTLEIRLDEFIPSHRLSSCLLSRESRVKPQFHVPIRILIFRQHKDQRTGIRVECDITAIVLSLYSLPSSVQHPLPFLFTDMEESQAS